MVEGREAGRALQRGRGGGGCGVDGGGALGRWSATAKEEAEAGAAPLYVPPVSRIYCDNKPAAEKSSFKKVMFSAARRRSTSTPMPRPPKGMQ